MNGAEDPVSALVDELEEARSMGELLKQGWKPRRTIIYCVWDGEEPGLLGSTEWGEEHADELRQHAAVYINTDANGRGYLFAGGSHTLEKFMNGVARDIEDPETNLSVWKRDQLHLIGSATPRGAPGSPHPPRLAPRALSVQGRTIRFSSIIWASPRSILASAAKTAAVFTIQFTMTFTGIHILAIPTSVMAGRWRKPSAPPCCALPTRTCFPSTSRISPIRSTPTPSN